MVRTATALGIAIASIGVYLVALLDPPEDGGWIVYGMATASAVLVGVLLIARARGNRIGPLLLLSGATLAAAGPLRQYAEVGLTQTPPWPGSGIVGVLAGELVFVPIVTVLIGIPLVFPDGHLLSPRWRSIVALVVATLAVSLAQNLIAPNLPRPAESYDGFPALAPLVPYLNAFTSTSVVVSFGGGAAALWIRFRSGSPIERQQLKWLLAVAALAGIFFTISSFAPTDAINEAFFLFGVLAMIAL